MNSEQNSKTFLSLIEKNKGIIYKVANSYCKNDADRKDLIQEIIFQLWRSFERYDESYKFSTWMYRLALNIAISNSRKHAVRKEILRPFEESIMNIVDNSVDDETEAEINLLQKFINELKELDRALMLLYLEGNNHQEIAEILGLSKTNVATKISRVKNQLKQKFAQIEG